MISFEKEVCAFLNIPSIPKKEWNGRDSFKNGVAIVKVGSQSQAYAIASFDADKDKAPRVVTTFSAEPFFGIEKVFTVPSYIDTNVKDMDLDDASKKAAEDLKKEVEELENEGNKSGIELPENEYCFDHIHNDEEAIAFIEAYNKENKIGGAVPKKHDSIIARLAVIYAEKAKMAPKADDKKDAATDVVEAGKQEEAAPEADGDKVEKEHEE